jgi:hypothetical protein
MLFSFIMLKGDKRRCVTKLIGYFPHFGNLELKELRSCIQVRFHNVAPFPSCGKTM